MVHIRKKWVSRIIGKGSEPFGRRSWVTLQGKEFLRLAKDQRVSQLAQIFGCNAAEYVSFVRNNYSGDWTKRLNRKSAIFWLG